MRLLAFLGVGDLGDRDDVPADEAFYKLHSGSCAERVEDHATVMAALAGSDTHRECEDQCA